MNISIMTGRLTKDPEIRYGGSNNDTCVASFSIAVDRPFSREKTTDFFNCVAFGKTGEFIEKYFHKGSAIAVTGSMQNDTYTNREGQKVTVTKLKVSEAEFNGPKDKTDREEKSPQKGSEWLPVADDVEELPFM